MRPKNAMGLNTIDLNNFNLHDDNFDDVDPETIICVRLSLGVIDINNTKHLKKVRAKN